MKAFYKYSILAGAILLAACQPKSEPKESQDKPTDPPVVQQTAEPILRGETVKLQVNLPECKGNTCPDFTLNDYKVISRSLTSYWINRFSIN
jgi:hypothetical protein